MATSFDVGGDEGDRTPDLLNAIGLHCSRHCQSVTNFHSCASFSVKIRNKCNDFE